MKVLTKTKNLDLTDDILNLVDEKFFALEKFTGILNSEASGNFKTLADMHVELQKETNHHKKGDIFLVSAEISLPGKKIVALARSDSLEKAVCAARDEMKLEIEKYKFKKIDKNRRPQRLKKI